MMNRDHDLRQGAITYVCRLLDDLGHGDLSHRVAFALSDRAAQEALAEGSAIAIRRVEVRTDDPDGFVRDFSRAPEDR